MKNPKFESKYEPRLAVYTYYLSSNIKIIHIMETVFTVYMNNRDMECYLNYGKIWENLEFGWQGNIMCKT